MSRVAYYWLVLFSAAAILAAPIFFGQYPSRLTAFVVFSALVGAYLLYEHLHLPDSVYFPHERARTTLFSWLFGIPILVNFALATTIFVLAGPGLRSDLIDVLLVAGILLLLAFFMMQLDSWLADGAHELVAISKIYSRLIVLVVLVTFVLVTPIQVSLAMELINLDSTDEQALQVSLCSENPDGPIASQSARYQCLMIYVLGEQITCEQVVTSVEASDAAAQCQRSLELDRVVPPFTATPPSWWRSLAVEQQNPRYCDFIGNVSLASDCRSLLN